MALSTARKRIIYLLRSTVKHLLMWRLRIYYNFTIHIIQIIVQLLSQLTTVDLTYENILLASEIY